MTRKEMKGWAMLIGLVLLVVGYFAFMSWICSQPVPKVDGYVPPYAVHTNTRH